MTDSKEAQILDQILNEEPNEDVNLDTNNFDIEELLKDTETYDIVKEDKEPLTFLKESEKSYQELLTTSSTIKPNVELNEIFSSLKSEKLNALPIQTSIPHQIFPKFKTPIDFVDYIETDYLTAKHRKQNVFYLQNYKLSNSKFCVLQFSPKTTLSSRFFKDGNIITCISANADVIFTGNNLGKIKMYSCEKEYEYKTLYNDEILSNQNKRGVTCMDISEKIDYLISGYMNGYIALWELNSSRCIKIIKDQLEDNVIAIKFLNVKNKEYEFLSGDLKGNVKKIKISEGYFFTSVEAVNVMNNNKDPVFLIEVLKLSASEIKMYEDFDEKPIIVAFGCLENIIIYQIEPIPKKLFVFEKPVYLNKQIHIPDISFGIGYPPRNKQYNNKGKGNTNEDEAPCDLNKLQRLIVISWEKVVYIYKLPFDLDTGANTPIFLGHYVNNTSILRMGFISDSIIYIFDMYKKFKILNTGLLTIGELKLDRDDSPIAQNKQIHPPELEKEKTIDQEISFQTFIHDRNSKDSKPGKATYNNFIISKMKTLYILGKRNFHYGKLLNWEQCINHLQQNSEWMDALTLGLDIYNGKNITLADIPIVENERKTKVGYILKGLILQYTVMNTSSEQSTTKREKLEELISKCINICIEFCLEINDINYLMNQIQPLFETKGYSDLFIEKLEPFILCDKISKQKLGKKTISKLKELYLQKNKIDIFAQMLIHLDIDSINREDIKDLCTEKKLLSPLVYIYMNNKEENYFYPIKVIYDMFIKAESINGFTSYGKILEEGKIDEIEKSKEYLGHKLFWYINLCLNGEKFKTKDKIPEQLYGDLTQKILLWILKDNVLETLIAFDPRTFFDVLTKIYIEESIYKNIINVTFDKDQVKDILLNDKQITKLKFDIIITILIEKCKKINKKIVLQDLYEFISKISIYHPQIEKSVIIETAKYLLSFNKRKEDSNKEEDKFDLHLKIWNEKDFIKRLSDDINAMISFRKNEIKTEELKELLKMTENTSFIYVKIFLANLIGDYKKCLDTYFSEENIDNKPNKTYEFIESTLKHLKDTQNIKLTEEFKSCILNRLIQLSSLSIPDLVKLVNNSFNDQHMKILDKLKSDKNTQLKYIECVLSKYKEEDLPNDELQMQNYISLLNFHLDILCELKLIDQILPNLKKRQSYPIDESLSKCIKFGADDAAIYLYKSTGALTEAFNLSITQLKKTLKQLFKFVCENNKDKYTSTLQIHQKNIDRSIEICEANSDKSTVSDTENVWFTLLQIFYDMSDKIKETQKDKGKEFDSLFLDFNRLISSNIKELLEKMYSYVGIKKIISKVTVKYKQAELKEFKTLLLQMLASYSFLKNILQCAQKLLSKTVGVKIEKYGRFILKGNYFNLIKCDECNREFIKMNEKICLFRCGHKMHLSCCLGEIEDLVCPICRKYKIESSITSANGNKKKMKVNKVEDKKEENEEEKKKEEENKEKGNMSVYKSEGNFDKLKNVDKFFIERKVFKKRKKGI